ncbi:tRNA (adenosine(37)-N6)-threonylcarbamoyltransferase complex transferase subunit TsaD [Candidatus Mycoplasma haematominutum]|uniref:N(6)-L-threonylcarbamoyladenine synthase n=1 Tax=Candidatus Mycoplasma haematominutum 'Birmingham 1' TaxID=1116213 RepID=G8C2L8_9MOLU|nr:tRNA (adenosine(37)-N6)-threonylcarbamoyltransferase complex transferase subunit TsaD [Candidatus Mycoplasma haematominutum]CCE66566.1 O-sialoglycoprotein endopeptidase [Candidatus Mycoplasma haematominutum 'Birmingham 1']
MSLILGIECTCDDSSAALFDTSSRQIVGESHYSSRHEHTDFGGIVPEIAARAHEAKLVHVIEDCLKRANATFVDIDQIAYSAEPGLPSSLLVGKMVASTLSICTHKTLIPINHLEAHIYSVGLSQPLRFPSLVLLITGKNTSIYLLNSELECSCLESCGDCALGEAFDKIARIMKLDHPGGHLLEKYYEENLNSPPLTRRSLNYRTLNLNFSGLITAARRMWEQYFEGDQLYNARTIVSTSFHREIIDLLELKLIHYLMDTNTSNLYVVGGVSRNKVIQRELKRRLDKKGVHCVWVDKRFAEDNGAMIAYRASLLLSR